MGNIKEKKREPDETCAVGWNCCPPKDVKVDDNVPALIATKPNIANIEHHTRPVGAMDPPPATIALTANPNTNMNPNITTELYPPKYPSVNIDPNIGNIS
jgi:hypothetical protein